MKKLVVGQAEWSIGDSDVENVVEQVRRAMQTGTMVELPLFDGLGRPVTVFFNGGVAPTAAIDLDGEPRPSEIV